jgi:hypothetical protein
MENMSSRPDFIERSLLPAQKRRLCRSHACNCHAVVGNVSVTENFLA